MIVDLPTSEHVCVAVPVKQETCVMVAVCSEQLDSEVDLEFELVGLLFGGDVLGGVGVGVGSSFGHLGPPP